mmetsp:Transcript_11705/g.40457  ORF Transcript_11705/g.40457 Transcript_11705/m.40457 type:complete len:230 (-) Transcript_11705:301-990(-)
MLSFLGNAKYLFNMLFLLLVLVEVQGFAPASAWSGPLAIGATQRKHITSIQSNRWLRQANTKGSGLTSLKALGGDAASRLKQTIRDYGFAAVLIHTTVWVTCLVMGYALLSNVDIKTVLSFLPESIKDDIDESSAAGLVRFQLSIAALEIIGPARLGFTLAVTPTVSGVMRKYQTTRDLEALVVRSTRKTARSLKSVPQMIQSNLLGREAVGGISAIQKVVSDGLVRYL